MRDARPPAPDPTPTRDPSRTSTSKDAFTAVRSRRRVKVPALTEAPCSIGSVMYMNAASATASYVMRMRRCFIVPSWCAHRRGTSRSGRYSRPEGPGRRRGSETTSGPVANTGTRMSLPWSRRTASLRLRSRPDAWHRSASPIMHAWPWATSSSSVDVRDLGNPWEVIRTPNRWPPLPPRLVPSDL